MQEAKLLKTAALYTKLTKLKESNQINSHYTQLDIHSFYFAVLYMAAPRKESTYLSSTVQEELYLKHPSYQVIVSEINSVTF